MLTIYQNQMSAFQKMIDYQFVASLNAHLRQHYQRYVDKLSDEVLSRRIRKGLAMARRYRMESAGNQALFVLLMFIVAPNFAMHPPIAKILMSRDEPDDTRMHFLVNLVDENQWREAARSYDPSFW
jgi:hypothetical protein